MPYLEVVLISACAIGFYRAGRREHSWAIVWAGASIAASFLALRFTRLGAVGLLLAQVAVFLAITLARIWRER